MFCKNCGGAMSDGDKFCQLCGTPVGVVNNEKVEEPVVETPVVEEPIAEEPAVEIPAAEELIAEEPVAEVTTAEPVVQNFTVDEPKKSNKKFKLIGIIAATVVVVVLAVFLFKDFVTARIVDITSPQNQMQYAYSKLVSDVSGYYGDVCDEVVKTTKKGATGKGSIELEVSEEFLSDLGADIGVNKLAVEYEANVQSDYLVGYDLSFVLDKTDILNVSMYMDMGNGEMIIDIPDLNDEAFVVEMPDADMSDMQEAYEILQNFDYEAILPDEVLVEKVATDILKEAFMAIEDVDKSKEQYSAGEVTDKVKCLTADITQETVCDMGTAVLEYVRDSKDIKKYIKDVVDVVSKMELADMEEVDMNKDEVYDNFVSAIDDALESIEDSKEYVSDDTIIEFKTYISSSYDILAIEVDVPDAETEVFFGKASKGSKTGYELNVKEYDDYILVVVGEGREKHGKFTGELEVEVDGDNIGTLSLEMFDTNFMENGYLSGTVEIIPSSELMEDISGSPLGDLADASVKIEFNDSKDKINDTIALILNEEEVATIKLSGSYENGGKVKLPTDTTDDEAWAENIDVNVLIDRLEEAGVSSEILDLLEGDLDLDSMFGSSSYDDYSDYDYNYDDYDYSYDDYSYDYY